MEDKPAETEVTVDVIRNMWRFSSWCVNDSLSDETSDGVLQHASNATEDRQLLFSHQ